MIPAPAITRFGAYEILYELKSGGMGAVLLGRRRGPGTFEQLVAIKTIRPEYANMPQVRAMFLDEAAILARLNHGAIATVHDFGDEGGTLYMVMEYVAGIPFRELADLKPPPGIAARAIAEACRGVHAAHELRDLGGSLLGVVHRDISPDNLMLGFDGHVKVIDFGIALVKNRQSPVTEFGTVKGKPPYMSPEQVMNEPMDRRSDVFSLALCLHELLTGQPVFDGDSIYAVARAVVHHEIPPPSMLAGSMPIGLDAAVMNALDRDLARRTPTAAELAEQLEAAIGMTGQESLEAWAERELAEHRDARRAWLAKIVGGHTAPSFVGRATGTVTPIASTMPAEVAQAAPPSGDQPPRPGESTHLAADTSDSYQPRRSLAVPVLLAILVLGAAGIGVFMMTRTPAGVVNDARTADAAVALDAQPDAPLEAPIVADAAILDATTEPLDAGRRTAPIDAGGRTAPRDAAVVPPDAAPAVVEPAGKGTLFVKHRPNSKYLVVFVDGKRFGNTPVLGKPLASGQHTVELFAPDTDELVYKTTITIDDGETETVQQP
ncbi:MAG TPA: protein kinase [Kofleriaceae bacterium]